MARVFCSGFSVSVIRVIRFRFVGCISLFRCLSLMSIEIDLSHDVAVIQWITSCHKNRMIARVIGHEPDMVYLPPPPRGSFEDHDFLKA